MYCRHYHPHHCCCRCYQLLQRCFHHYRYCHFPHCYSCFFCYYRCYCHHYRYRYRYYTQAGATFYRDDYTAPGGVHGYMTGDYRLGDFGAHLFGGRVSWNTGQWLRRIGVAAPAQLMFSYERYFNSNNFSATIVETGLSIAF